MAGSAVVEIGHGTGTTGVAASQRSAGLGIIAESNRFSVAVAPYGLEILGRRSNISVSHVLSAVDDDVTHRAERGSLRTRACLQELNQIVDAPVAQRSSSPVSQTGGKVILYHGS